MNRPLAIGLLVGGILLVAFGISSADSLGSDVSRFFTGHPTDKAVWFLVVGAITSAVGFFSLYQGRVHHAS